ncbi:MAG: Ig-like domain-containing protein, partial [Planctomycetes bacterium]|nr:Ig-like domain-containing protein [Planctomycetota bacterium]
RFSSTGGLQPTGFAADGEVEDYEVQILDGNPPLANSDTYAFDEDNVGVGSSVLANDFDADAGDQANLTVFSYQGTTKLGATVVMDTSANSATKGTFTYDPRGSAILQGLDVNETIIDTFIYRAYDGDFLSAPATVTITVSGRNDAPTANPDPDFANSEPEIQTDQNSPIDIRVLDNDVDPEGDPLTITGVTGGRGTVTVQGSVVHYDPRGAFNELDLGQDDTDTFTYSISDGKGGTASATVTVRVFGRNDSPLAVNDAYPDNPTATTTEASPAVIDVLRNDSDPEGSSLTVVSVQTVGTRGTVVVNSLGTANNSVTYNPNGKFEYLGVGATGTDTFAYVVQDEQGNASSATVTVTIQGVNDPPTARNDANINVARNSFVQISVLNNDTDIDGDSLRVVGVDLVSLNTKGTVDINADNTVTYNPNGQFDNLSVGQTGTDRFRYTIEDFNGGTSTATVTVTVIGASDPPVANDDQITTTEDDSVAISVLFNDDDDFGPLIVSDVDPMSIRGSVIISPLNQPNNLVIYSPDGQFDSLKAGQQATEVFRYTVTDGIGSDTAMVTVTITGVNDAPIANIDANGYFAQRGKTLRANDATGTTTPGVPTDDGVLLNDTDAEGDSLTAELVTGPTHGVLQLNADGTFVYSHNGDSATRDTFSYRARDASGALSQAPVTVVINIVDSPPAEWQNPINRFDVNNDGFVSPIDVLMVINLLNDPNRGTGYEFPSPHPVGEPLYDVDGDGLATPQDALGAINEVNRLNSGGSGEGESVPEQAVADGRSAAVTAASEWTDVTAVPVSSGPSDAGTALAESLEQTTSEADANARRPSAAKDRTSQQPETIRVDLFGIEDALTDIAEDILDSRSDATPWDDVLDELLA